MHMQSWTRRMWLPCLLMTNALGCVSAALGAPGAGIEPYVKMRWPDSAQLAPDGTLYYRYNPDGIFQLYKLPAGKTQKDAVKLTTFKDGMGRYSLRARSVIT